MNKHSARQQSINAERRLINNGGFNSHIPTIHPEGMTENDGGYEIIRNNQISLVESILSNPRFLLRQKNGHKILQSHIHHLGELAKNFSEYKRYVQAMLIEMQELRSMQGRIAVLKAATSFFYRCKFRSAYIVFGKDRKEEIDELHETYLAIHRTKD